MPIIELGCASQARDRANQGRARSDETVREERLPGGTDVADSATCDQLLTSKLMVANWLGSLCEVTVTEIGIDEPAGALELTASTR